MKSNTPIKFIVCGGRDFSNMPNRLTKSNAVEYALKKKEQQYVFAMLDILAIKYSSFYNKYDNWLPNDIMVISGGAKGVDSAAIDWAVVNWCISATYEADWDKHKKAAGPIRNQLMLDSEVPIVNGVHQIKDIHLIAFPGGKGTEDMVRRATKIGLNIIRFTMHDFEEWKSIHV